MVVEEGVGVPWHLQKGRLTQTCGKKRAPKANSRDGQMSPQGRKEARPAGLWEGRGVTGERDFMLELRCKKLGTCRKLQFVLCKERRR